MDPGPRHQLFKLFIGGLTIETTESDVMNHFSKFGFVFDVLIIRNRETAVSKGYGFISCNNMSTYQRILSTDHMIDGRLIDCHDSFKKNEEPQKFKENANKKIFVGGISLETSDMDLAEYFGQFGPIRQAYVIKDPVSKRSKKFGFAIMKTQESVDKVLSTPVHVLKGIVVSCKLFVRLDNNSGKSSQQLASKNTRMETEEQLSVCQSMSGFRDGLENFGVNHHQRESTVSEYLDAEYSDYIDNGESAENFFREPERQILGDVPFFAFGARDRYRHRFGNHMSQSDTSGSPGFEFDFSSSQPQGFGMITDGYVAPIVIDQDGDQGFDQIKFDGFRASAKPIETQEIQDVLAVTQPAYCSSAGGPEKVASELRQSRINIQHHSNLGTSCRMAPGQIYGAWNPNELSLNQPKKEPPPSTTGLSLPQKQPHAAGLLVALIQGVSADPNIRFNWCFSRRFYRSLRSRKPKVF